MKGFLLILLIIAVIAIGPIITIWAVSTLWNFTPVYDFWHWLAAAILGGSLFASKKSSD